MPPRTTDPARRLSDSRQRTPGARVAQVPPKTDRIVKTVVSDIPSGAVARHKGWWGVVGPWSSGARHFHRWDAEDTRLWPYEVLEVLERVVQQTNRPKDESTSQP